MNQLCKPSLTMKVLNGDVNSIAKRVFSNSPLKKNMQRKLQTDA